MYIRIFEYTIEEAEPLWRIVLPTEYYRKHRTLDISRISLVLRASCVILYFQISYKRTKIGNLLVRKLLTSNSSFESSLRP